MRSWEDRTQALREHLITGQRLVEEERRLREEHWALVTLLDEGASEEDKAKHPLERVRALKETVARHAPLARAAVAYAKAERNERAVMDFQAWQILRDAAIRSAAEFSLDPETEPPSPPAEGSPCQACGGKGTTSGHPFFGPYPSPRPCPACRHVEFLAWSEDGRQATAEAKAGAPRNPGPNDIGVQVRATQKSARIWGFERQPLWGNEGEIAEVSTLSSFGFRLYGPDRTVFRVVHRFGSERMSRWYDADELEVLPPPRPLTDADDGASRG